MAPGLCATGALLLYVGLAVLWDVRERRIPNWLSGTWLLVALPSATLDEGIGLPAALAGLGLAGAALLGPYLAGAVGAGDLKFAAVAGAWLDWGTIFAVIELAALSAPSAYLVNAYVRKRPLKATAFLPFGLFLAPAIWIGWLAEALLG